MYFLMPQVISEIEIPILIQPYPHVNLTLISL